MEHVMDDVTTILLQQVVVPVLTSVLIAFGGWAVTKLPGPLRDALQANVHAKDVKIIMDAAMNRAAALAAGHGSTASPVDDVIAYIRHSAPGVVAKLAPTDEALRTIAVAKISGARAEVQAFDAIAAARNGSNGRV
jgi:hypothetical protein